MKQGHTVYSSEEEKRAPEHLKAFHLRIIVQSANALSSELSRLDIELVAATSNDDGGAASGLKPC